MTPQEEQKEREAFCAHYRITLNHNWAPYAERWDAWLACAEAKRAKDEADKRRLDFLESLAYGWADHEGTVPDGAMRCVEVTMDLDYFREESFREGIDRLMELAREKADEPPIWNPFNRPGTAAKGTWRSHLNRLKDFFQ